MTNLITQKNSDQTLSPAQKTFHRLNQQINDLKHTLELRRNELETGAVYYCQHIIPSEKAIAKALIELTKIRYRLYKNRSDLRASDRETLKEIMLYEINAIFEPLDPLEVDQEIEDIFKELQGKGRSECLMEESEEMKEELETFLKAQGMDVDLSQVDPFASQEEIMKKMLDAFQQRVGSGNEETQRKAKPKSKKQIEKQQKIDAFKEAQKKGISALYKQLARVLHPDLEQDPIQQARKVELMKELTLAYENNDLLTLLDLEMQWISDGSHDKTQSRSQEQLKLYNSILREQIELLRASIDGLIFHPRYFFAQDYDESGIPLQYCLKEHRKGLQRQLAEQQNLIHRLGSWISLKNLRAELEETTSQMYLSSLFLNRA